MMKVAAGIFFGFLFGVCFLAGLAFLAGNQVYYETSDSMRPTIRKGSLLLVKKKDNYQEGDIVVFYTWYEGEKMCVTHRITRKISENVYVTKGDANAREDGGTVLREKILGKVTGYIPYYGYVCSWMKDNILFLFLMIIAVILRGHALSSGEKKMGPG